MNRISIHRRAQQLLPAAIETSGLLQLGMSPDQMAGIVLESIFGGDAGGIVVLRLASRTAAAIQRQGLVFFAQARQARAGLPRHAPARYGHWRQVRGGAGQGAAGTSPMYAAATLDAQSWLAVLPVERLVLYGRMH